MLSAWRPDAQGPGGKTRAPGGYRQPGWRGSPRSASSAARRARAVCRDRCLAAQHAGSMLCVLSPGPCTAEQQLHVRGRRETVLGGGGGTLRNGLPGRLLGLAMHAEWCTKLVSADSSRGASRPLPVLAAVHFAQRANKHRKRTALNRTSLKVCCPQKQSLLIS